MNERLPDARTFVENCIDELLAAGADRENVLRARCAERPDLANVLQRRVDTLRQLGLLDARGRDDRAPRQLGDYRLLERLGQGGMGTVWIAERESLGRRVALKVIRAEQMLFPGARERFQREIETIARLQVPGVVPILDVGEADDIPFYAMELFDGIDLARLVARLRDAGAKPSDQDGSAFATTLAGPLDNVCDESGLFEGGHVRIAARIAMRLARTLAQVHAHNIVHRDIKPSNVIVDRHGRVTLVDFGLAHLADSGEITRSGAVLGSMPYMAPEQLRGERASIGPRTDVYGVGVTLHELLYLEPAFETANPIELRDLVYAGRRARTGAAHDLETIIACATDPDPTRRYPSADALADDLLRFLERRPVLARRSSVWLRAHRWAQRHPARATALALTALLAFAVPVAIAIERTTAAAELQESLAEVERQRANYQRTLQGALEALDGSVLRLLGDASVAHASGLDPALNDSLDSLAAFYETLHDHDPDTFEIRRALVIARTRHAEILDRLGRLEQSIATSDQVLAMTEGDPRTRRIRFEVRMRRGGVFDRMGEFGAAITEWRAARVELGPIEEPEFEDRIRIGRSLHVEASILSGQFDPGALAACRQAIQWFEDLAEEFPASDEALGYLAMSTRVLARIVGRSQQSDGSFKLLADIVRRLESFLESDPQNISIRSDLASTLDALASQLRYAGRDASALPILRRAAELRREIVRTWPHREKSVGELVSSLSDLGSSLCRSGDSAAARPVLAEAQRVGEAQLARSPDSHKLRGELAQVYTWLGTATQDLEGPGRDAVELLEKGVAILEQLAAGNSDREQEASYALGAAYAMAAAGRYNVGAFDRATDHFLNSRDCFRRVLMRAPEDALARRQLSELLLHAVSAVSRAGRPRSVHEELLRDAIELDLDNASLIDALRDRLGDDYVEAQLNARQLGRPAPRDR